MNGVKSPFQSLTVNAATVALLSGMLNLLGVQIDPDLVSQGVDTVLQLVSIVGMGVAIYGRVRATAKIGKP